MKNNKLYNRFFKNNWLIRTIEDKAIHQAIRQYAKGKLLDIGCGGKPYEKIAQKYVTEHIGIDHKDTRHDQSNINYFGTAYQLPFENEKFHTVLCTFVLEHLEDPDSALKEAHRVLNKDGYAIYAVPFIWFLHEEPRDFFRFTKFGLIQIFKRNGFEIIHLEPLAGFWVSFGQMLVYYLWHFRLQGKINPLWWIIPPISSIIQCICFVLNSLDARLCRILKKEKMRDEFCCEYLIVAEKCK
jgi:ubiquinone/menaquinone biosynthesis C-methylase UbiE